MADASTTTDSTTPLTLQQAVAKGMTYGQWFGQSGIDQGNSSTPGFSFVNSGNTQTLGMTPQENANLGSGVATANAATGGNESAYQYDKEINPTSYQARWNADGTPNYGGTSGSSAYVPGSGANGIIASASGKTPNSTSTPMTTEPPPLVTPTAAGNNSGIVNSARDPHQNERTPNQGGTGMQIGAPGAAQSASGANLGQGMYGWDVTPNQTVEGRIASIINPNNPIIQQAEAQAVDNMNSRGLANSSLATTAADAAAYQAAIPIAQQDAGTYAKAAGYNSDIQNQATMQGRQLSNQMAIAKLNAQTQTYLGQLDAQTRTSLQGMQNQNALLIQSDSQAATMWNQGIAAISTIQNNDKMDATSKTKAISQILQNLNNQLASMSKASGVNNTMNLSSYPGFDANGNYVGFDANGNTVGSTGTPTSASQETTNPFGGVTVNDSGGGA